MLPALRLFLSAGILVAALPAWGDGQLPTLPSSSPAQLPSLSSASVNMVDPDNLLPGESK